MPLHDWTDLDDWEGMHLYWMTEIGRAIRQTLPPPYRVILGSSPLVSIGGEGVKPDVAVARSQANADPETVSVSPFREPDFEAAMADVEDDDTTVQIERNGRLVAAIELVSPRNKNRPSSRDQYATRYANYLRGGVHLLLVDVHRRPIGFSFPQLVAAAFDPRLPAPPAPCAVTYRVGAAAATGGRMLAVWREPLAIGEPLPRVSLPLTLDLSVPIDLEATYSEAATNCYLT